MSPLSTEAVDLPAPPDGTLDASMDFRSRIRAYEVSLIESALQQCGWNQSEAARRLGLPRRTLVAKIRTYGIRKPSTN